MEESGIQGSVVDNPACASTESGARQIIKCRDDARVVFLRDSDDVASATRTFKLSEATSCSWAKPEDSLGPDLLRHRIEPWLTALVQSEHLSLLVGSGLTHAVHRLATDKGLPGMTTISFKTMEREIEAEAMRTAELANREKGNFEDQIRVATELLRGLEIIASTKPPDAPEARQLAVLRTELTNALQSFADTILEGERNVVSAQSAQRELAFNYLVNFLMSFASRSGTRERLQIFTTNYDRYIEAGADVAGLRLVDRFVGMLAPIFRSSRLDIDLHYNPPGIRGEPRYLEGVARFTKLHGSVDWLDRDSAIQRIGLPFGASNTASMLSAATDARNLMIYPNAAKDRETASYPYVELFRDFAASICRPNSTLVCYGYGFGDEHINQVVEDMLTIPSVHLVIIAFGDPLGRILKTYERLGRHAQISLLIGDHFGDLKPLCDNYLPKPAIDRTTFRMAELLKSRWSTAPSGDQSPETTLGGETDSAK